MIGENIKRIREDKNIRLSTLAKIVGISAGYLSDIENGVKKNPSMDKLQSIADALDVPVSEFLTTEDKLEISKDALRKIIDLSYTANLDDSPVVKEYSEKYTVTSRDKKQYIDHMKKANEAFFMNDEFDEDDKKEILDAMTEVFWKAKTMRKKKTTDK